MRIIIADDHELMRSGLRALLGADATVEIVAEVSDGPAAVRLAKELHPDLVVMDIDMPGMNGIEATRQIKSTANGAKVMALTALRSEQSVRAMLDAGASAYVVKTAAFRDFADALAAIRAGETYLSPGTPAPNGLSLTEREREVLRHLAEGLATKEVAAKLGLSIKTIETHRKNIMGKLDLHSIAELTKYAIRDGLTGI